MGHVAGRVLGREYEAAPETAPASYMRTVDAPVLNQEETPECEAFTAATGRRLTQGPVGQDGFDPDDIYRQAGGTGSSGLTTASVEKVLIAPGASCISGPGIGQRWPVASCQNISSMGQLKSALQATQFVGLAVDWDESWYEPSRDGTLPPPSGQIAGGHIFDVAGWQDPTRAALRCQNSWGTEWGDGGFFWLPYSYLPSRLEAYTQIAKPLVPYTPTEAQDMITFTAPIDFLDTRTPSNPLAVGAPRIVQIAGVHGLPKEVKGITGTLTITDSTAGWAASVGPDAAHQAVVVSFTKGQVVTGSVTVGLSPTGGIVLNYLGSAGAKCDAVLYVTAYWT